MIRASHAVQKTPHQWEVVCPDGLLRHFPYINEGDARHDAKLMTERRRCNFYPKPSVLETQLGPCPLGEHVARRVQETAVV